ncbi:T9SS type B sorting domain-containing protein [Confluentibacter lentus]|uniref:T9SS type B sorting domain-containing protein n=1 Tax=Confluentibacter lentus TaxID=1699412 RepID=UPI000C28BF02|nr:T9SS type B sorting domain-containing protein [Confluentibacter lentus]
MKKPTYSKIGIIILILFLSFQSFSQNLIPFVPRYDEAIKGDMLLIGNSNLSVHRTDPYNYAGTNSSYNNEGSNNRDRMVYVDIDIDNTTFNSSSADLDVPNDATCYQIVYAGLYWSSVVMGDTPMASIKFRTPESGTYIDITGTQIYYQNSSNNRDSNTYAYYRDVTDILTALSNPEGTYTVANISSMTSAMMNSGTGRNTEGLSAGWSLFVIYEDPLLPSKYITSFDGFTKINNVAPNNQQTFPISGFQTIPTGPVRAKYAFSALEGDRAWAGDYLQINGTSISATTAGGTIIRPSNNFFNSSVSIIDPNTNSPILFTNRNPSSSNTLGFDAGIINIPNPGNSLIANGDTSATIRLGTNTDIYYFYFSAFAIEIIAPNIVLTKIVEDVLGNDIGGQVVDLGDELYYTIGFQNTGNDDATDMTIRDVLPTNVVFNYPSDIGLLPAGVTVQSYNPATRELIFAIDESVVEENDPVSEIRFKVTVVSTCSLLSDACSNNIDNQAYATYKGTINPDFTISDDPSFASNTGCLLTPGATNFLADLNDCVFEENIILCGSSAVLTAGNGYDAYSWTNSSGTVIGTTQSITVTTPGTYYVHNTAVAPCQSIDQVFNVITYGAGVTNPVIPFADEVVICPNDGKELPNIFLCGANDSRFIQTNITDTSSMIWERLDETSCTAVANEDCANEDASCTWNQVATGPDFTADTAGQYRLTLNYTGGCFNQFYFNVYENLLVPTVTSRDIFCTTPGEITVGSVPSGYEYSIDGVNYQTSNVFSINTTNIYSVYIRQIGVTPNPCIFSVPDVQIRQRDFTVSTIITQPLCNGEQGSVVLAANDVRPQYFFSIYQGATLINSVGPIMESDYTFANLNPGTYTINVSTEDGCIFTDDIEIINPPLLTATAALTKPLTCTDGEITVYPSGGTAPYYYFVNSTTEFQSTPQIIVTTPGVYNITVVDSNNCSTTTSITVNPSPPPVFNVTKTDMLCEDSGDNGTITINVTNANGNSLQYSIDNGVTFFNSPTFTGLAVGSYDVVVQYTLGTDVCTTTPQTITITEPPAITGTATLTTPYTCTTNGVITVSGVSGGTAPYTYSINGITFQPGLTFSGLTNGTYTVTIRDAVGCTFITAPITIAPLNPPTDLSFASTPLTCPTNVSTVTLTATGGIGTLRYQIIAPGASTTPYQASNVFSGLAPGTYTFQVIDEYNCTYSESYTINPLPALTVIGQNLNDVTCFGAADGSAQFTVSGSTGFTYTINGGASTVGTSPVSLTGLASGTYTIVITDNTTNCSATASITINQPTTALDITATASPITCLNNGSVVLNTTGGWGGNSFTLTLPDATVLPGQNSNIFANLTQAGTYTATVTDTNGCSDSTTFNLVLPINPTATISVSSDYCYDTTNGASLQVTASGGQAPYQYSMNGAPFTANNVFSNLIPGIYNITVRDSYGCTYTLPAETIASQLAVSTVLTKDLDCTASPDAVITGTISGGYAPFTYAVSFNGGAFNALGSTGSPFIYATAINGTYRFQVTDARGCTALSGVQTINAISLPEIISVVQTQPILCHGDSNAAIQININYTVGTPPFVINVNNDTTGTNYGTQTSGLTAGTYTITLTDSKSCTDTATITITEPTPIIITSSTVPITCDPVGGVSKGSVIINGVTGGTAPYNYFVTGTNGYSASELNASGTTSTTFDVVDFGLYQINVVDSNGCSVLIQDVLVASPPDDLDIAIDVIADCTTGGEAVISVGTTLASAGPFFFDIYRGFVPPAPPGGTWIPEDAPSSKTATFTGLIPGFTYTFIVYDDSTGCSYYETSTVPIPTNSTLTANALTSNNITCVGSADGNVSFTINSIYGISTNVNYEIFNSLSLLSTGITGSGVVPGGGSLPVSNLGSLPYGNYFVLITETSGPNLGCGVVTVPFNIRESAIDLSITASVDRNANCNPSSGIITAIARDGTAPYLYQMTTSATPPLSTDPLWASANTFNRDAGSYYVHVIDAYGCIKSTAVIVLPQDPTPVVSATVNNQCTVTEGNFEIDVTLPTAGIAPYAFSINGGAFQTRTAPFTLSNLSSGTHTIEVRDVNGCGNLVSVDIEPPLGITPTVTGIVSCSNDDGEITVSAVGGTGIYTYSISPNPASITLAGNVFSGVPSGTYTITIEDSATGCTEDATITLDAATPVTFTTTPSDVSCNGGSDGAITVNLPLSNDNPPYTYEISGPISVGPQASNIFTGLPAGIYDVTVASGRNCTLTQQETIGEPVLLAVSGTATDFACAIDGSVNTSELTISESGGMPSYTYSINGINYFNSNVFKIVDNGSTQNITVYVRDANGCVATNTVIILPLPTITAAAVAEVTPIDCNNTGSISISVTGGSGNFNYQMLPSGVPQASNIFNITLPGDYYFLVTDLTTSCTFATAAYTVAPFDTIDAIATATTAVTCFGDTNGALEVNLSGYTGAYTYEVFDSLGVSVLGPIAANTSVNPQIISGLPAGSFTVVVTETASPFCNTTSNMVTIATPILPLDLVISETSNVTCDDGQGTITAIASGGWGTYEYELTGAVTVAYSSNGTFRNLSAGSYTVNVRDSGGCIVSDAITLTIPTQITATVTADTTLLSCFDDSNATITATAVSGGQGSNYTYTLHMLSPMVTSSGPQISPIFNGLGAGTYNVTITDGYNCEFTSPNIIINQPAEVQALLVRETSPSCLTDATLTLSATGGTGTYEYSNTATFATILGSFTSSTAPISVSPGTYMYYVRDANGCIANVSNEITIDPLPALIINLDVANATINCTGDNTAVIVAVAQGGLGNYIYTLLDSGGNPIPTATQNSPGVFTELTVGTYQIRVDSGDCLTTSAPIQISEPAAALTANFFPTDPTCFGSGDGMLEIVASGGTGTIKYAISPQMNQFFETSVFEDLYPGTYQAIAQDELGCYILFDFTITDPAPVQIALVPGSIQPELCEGDLNGAFSVIISGGSMPYSVALDDRNGSYIIGTPTQTQFDFAGLSGGDHTVYVIDGAGCESEVVISFPESVSFGPTAVVEYGCDNNIPSNTVTVIITGNVDTDDLTYSLDGGAYQASNLFVNVPSGVGHYVDVMHVNGCIQRTPLFDVDHFDPIALVLNDGGLNEIVAITTGGSGVYQYTLNGEDYGSTNTFLIYRSGDYTVTVTDSYGCTASATRYFEYIDVCIPNYFTPPSQKWGPGCTSQYTNLTVDIFDRYGREIATLRVGDLWDGNYNGKELPTGDYWYVVKLNDPKDNRDFVGHFTLYR